MSSSQLILDLDNTLRDVLKQPTLDNIHHCFSVIRQCHYRRLADDKSVQDDSLYIPTILLLRQFNRFQSPSTFDTLLEEFRSLFPLIPICTKKILDDFLCIISIIFTKRIMMSNDEVQQNLFLRFFRAFCSAIRMNPTFFYREFLGNFNDNLPILGHYLSCLLQLYEKVNTLDYRLDIIETIWSLFSSNEYENEYREMIGQILACFLPGILKTLVQDVGSIHQRLIQSNLNLLSYILRITVRRSAKPLPIQEIKVELREMIVERNDQWLSIVDAHLAPLLQRLTKDYINHESVDVRRALGLFMLTILSFCSEWLTISANIALKTMLALISYQNELNMFKILLEKLFKLPMGSTPEEFPSLLPYENELINAILHSSDITLPDRLLIECQADLFHLLDQQSSTFTDRQWRLQLFIGYYTFIHHHIDFLFDMNVFTEKFFRFISNTLDFPTLLRTNLNLLNETSLPSKQTFDTSVYKYFNSDVHREIDQLIRLFMISHEEFLDYLLEQINEKQIIDETNQKIFYLLSIIFEKKAMKTLEDYQRILSFLNRLISEENHRRKHLRRRKSKKVDQPISTRNFAIYYLLQCLRSCTPTNQPEYLIDYIPLLLLCHSSAYTIIHQTALFCLTSISNDDLPQFLLSQSEYIVDTSLQKLQTSAYDGYLILIELIRLGNQPVINLPIMTHVIEQLLLELACLPAIEVIELTFQFLNVFCQQVVDIVEEKKIKPTLIPSVSKSLVEYALDLQNELQPPDSSENEPEKQDTKHPWHEMLVSIVDVFQHFISHSNFHIRSYVLDAFPSLAELLSTIDENLFLPLVHKLWPGLIHRLHDPDWNIRIRCVTTIQCLCRICSDFVDRRIRQDILPILIQQLESNRLISSSNTLEYRYTKHLLTNIASIVHSLTMNLDEIEKLVLILLQYLQVDQLASIAFEQLLFLTTKYSDIIWLKLILHDENEYRKGYFHQMKVYKPEPMFTIDAKWKSSLLNC